MSALPPKADIGGAAQYVCLVPRADIHNEKNMAGYRGDLGVFPGALMAQATTYHLYL